MWPNPQETAALVTFTEEIRNGKLHFCAVVFAISDNEIRIPYDQIDLSLPRQSHILILTCYGRLSQWIRKKTNNRDEFWSMYNICQTHVLATRLSALSLKLFVYCLECKLLREKFDLLELYPLVDESSAGMKR